MQKDWRGVGRLQVLLNAFAIATFSTIFFSIFISTPRLAAARWIAILSRDLTTAPLIFRGFKVRNFAYFQYHLNLNRWV